MELLHKGAPFFTMTYKLTGKMELIFQDRKPNDPAVYLKGELNGKAQDIDCSITMVPFALPASLTLAFCRSALPPVSRKTVLIYLEGKGNKSTAEKEFNREIFLPETPKRKAVRVTMKSKIKLSSKG